MNKVKIKTRHNEYTKTDYYRDFNVVDEIPTIESNIAECIANKSTAVVEVVSLSKDCSDDTTYDCYLVKTFDYGRYIEDEDIDDSITEEYVAFDWEKKYNEVMDALTEEIELFMKDLDEESDDYKTLESLLNESIDMDELESKFLKVVNKYVAE